MKDEVAAVLLADQQLRHRLLPRSASRLPGRWRADRHRALHSIGLNFAPLIGLLVVVLTMIPYIGIVLCWVPAVLIAAAQWGDWCASAYRSRSFSSSCKISKRFFYAPRIVGNSVGLHPMTVIVSIFVWGLLIGGLLGPDPRRAAHRDAKVLLARYVWGRRLREEVTDAVEDVPVVEAESKSAANACEASNQAIGTRSCSLARRKHRNGKMPAKVKRVRRMRRKSAR